MDKSQEILPKKLEDPIFPGTNAGIKTYLPEVSSC